MCSLSSKFIFNTFCLQLNLETGEIDRVVKCENGCTVFVQGGNNIGRVGTLMHIEHHPGSYEIVHVKDAAGNTFATRLSNIFVVGQNKKAIVTLPKLKGVRQSLVEERNHKIASYARNAEVDEDDE